MKDKIHLAIIIIIVTSIFLTYATPFSKERLDAIEEIDKNYCKTSHLDGTYCYETPNLIGFMLVLYPFYKLFSPTIFVVAYLIINCLLTIVTIFVIYKFVKFPAYLLMFSFFPFFRYFLKWTSMGISILLVLLFIHLYNKKKYILSGWAIVPFCLIRPELGIILFVLFCMQRKAIYILQMIIFFVIYFFSYLLVYGDMFAHFKAIHYTPIINLTYIIYTIMAISILIIAIFLTLKMKRGFLFYSALSLTFIYILLLILGRPTFTCCFVRYYGGGLGIIHLIYYSKIFKLR